MPISDYSHYNEEAALMYFAENDMDSPMCDMSDEDIKQAVYDRMNDDELCDDDY